MPSGKLSTLVFPVLVAAGGLWLLYIGAPALHDAQTQSNMLYRIGYWTDAKFVAAAAKADRELTHAKLIVAAGVLALGAGLFVRFRSACHTAVQRCFVDRCSVGAWVTAGMILLAFAAGAWWELNVVEPTTGILRFPSIAPMANRFGGKFGTLAFLGGAGLLFLLLALLHMQREAQRNTIAEAEKTEPDPNTFRFFVGGS